MQNRESTRQTSRESSIGPLLVAAAAAIAFAIFATRTHDRDARVAVAQSQAANQIATQPASGNATSVAQGTNAPGASPVWAVSAPGRVEPKGGEIKLSPQASGRITEVLVVANQQVVAGDLLIRLEDSELEARLAATDAEVSVRRRDRDQETVGQPQRDRRNAEDAAFSAERLFGLNRVEFDRWLVARKAGTATDLDVARARETVVKARDAMVAARVALRRILANDTLPMQTRLEASLAAARAEMSMADAAFERTRIRAPQDGTILQISATPGESVAPSPESVLVVLGDISGLRVKTEVEDRDIGKIHVGQSTTIRSDAFPGREFEGRVAALSQSLGQSKLGQKGPRKLNDVDVLEVTVDLVGKPPLLPGMRVDVFYKADATPNQPQPKAN